MSGSSSSQRRVRALSTPLPPAEPTVDESPVKEPPETPELFIPVPKSETGSFSYSEYSDVDPSAPFDERDLIVRIDEEEASGELMSVYQALCSAIRGTPLLSAKEEKEMALRIKAGDVETHQRFVLSNIRLVLACVKQVRRRLSGLPTLSEFMDLVQEGVLALCIAVDGYDPRWGTRFSTYAVPWIYPRLRRYYAQHRPGFSVSGNAGADSLCLSRYVLLHRDGRRDQIPAKLRKRVADLARMSSAVLAIESNSFMADEPTTPYCIAEDRLSKEMESQAGGHSPSADEVVEDRIFRESIRTMLTTLLTPDQADICFRRFGIRPYAVPENLSQIAKSYGCSTEAIRSTVDQSLSILRKHPKVQNLMFQWLRPDEADGIVEAEDILPDDVLLGPDWADEETNEPSGLRSLDEMSEEELWAKLQCGLTGNSDKPAE